MARIAAPTTNCGFTITGSAGWIRLWLTNDDPNRSSGDLWALPGVFYPLSVAEYELPAESQHPDSLVFNETATLGGYTRSLGLDEAPYSNLPANIGLYAGNPAGITTLAPRGSSLLSTVLAPGEFYAQDVEAVDSVNYLFLVMA